MTQCPCHSGQPYESCCRPFHRHEISPPTALALMRARYAAYALALAEFITDTTHPDNPEFQMDKKKWEKEILAFAKGTEFKDLQIVNTESGSEESYVTFIAHLIQKGKPFEQRERSRFKNLGGRWFYLSGKTF